MDQNGGTVAILEATAEVRTLIEDFSRLGEELKVRQERLGELLAPSEAALRARTEYLDEDREGALRAPADGRLASGDATRRLPGGPSRQLPLWPGNEREDVNGRSREQGHEERTRFATPSRNQVERRTRALSREEIAQSADLQRRYAQEYASMLRVVSDREVAKEAARVNVSALVAGQPRIVPFEGRFSVEMLRGAISRGGEDLGVIRRDVSRLIQRRAPEISGFGLRSGGTLAGAMSALVAA
jgi:hypothetical protein